MPSGSTLGGIPLTATALDGRIWITLEDEPRLAVLDPRTGKVTQTADLGGTLSATVASGGRLWVGDFGAIVEDGKGARRPSIRAPAERAAAIATIEPYELVADDDVGVDHRTSRTSSSASTCAAARPDEPIRVDRPFDLVLDGGRVWVVGQRRSASWSPSTRAPDEPDGRPIGVGARPLAAAARAG